MTVRSSKTHPAMSRRSFFLAGGASAGALGAGALTAQWMPARARGADAPQTGPAELLDVQTRRALRWAGRTPPDWVRPRPGVDHNVLIVGGGQSGLAIAYGLRRKGVGRVTVIDRCEPGQAGIWRNIARMRQLRTPKTIPGPELGNPDLGFRAWYETLNGSAAFDALDRIPRLAWADYLSWYEQVTEAGVRYRTRLLGIEATGDVLRLQLDTDGTQRIETARKLVLASGFKGAGGISIPAVLHGLPADLWSHTDAPFDFSRLSGKVVGVIGAGASAFDAAATALEQGAREVHVYSRRSYVDYPAPGITQPPGPAGDRGHAFVLELAGELPDEVRWRDWRARENSAASVPMDSIARVVAAKNFQLHLDSDWTDVAAAGGGVTARISGRKHRFDHVIAGTGYRVDLSAQPELAAIQPDIALWKDRYRPPVGEEDTAVGMYPYLGTGFQFLPKAAGRADHLRNIHCFNIAASASFGTLVGDIPSVPQQSRLVAAITRDLFLEGVDLAQNRRYATVPVVPPSPAPYQSALGRR
jgi:FAD-dependent urate hydroxylase